MPKNIQLENKVTKLLATCLLDGQKSPLSLSSLKLWHTERQAAVAASPSHWNTLWRCKIGPRPIPKRHHRPNAFNLTLILTLPLPLMLTLGVFIPLVVSRSNSWGHYFLAVSVIFYNKIEVWNPRNLPNISNTTASNILPKINSMNEYM